MPKTTITSDLTVGPTVLSCVLSDPTAWDSLFCHLSKSHPQGSIQCHLFIKFSDRLPQLDARSLTSLIPTESLFKIS